MANDIPMSFLNYADKVEEEKCLESGLTDLETPGFFYISEQTDNCKNHKRRDESRKFGKNRNWVGHSVYKV